jgi:hypothetical protein
MNVPPYLPPFSAHTNLVAQHETFIGGGIATGLATLTLLLNPSIIAPCTHTQFDVDWFLTSGRSPTTIIERCEFRASFFSAAIQPSLIKGLFCSLLIKPGTAPWSCRLDIGGLMEGGEIYRFRLVDSSFHA